MRQSGFSEEQIVAILREADRGSVAEAAPKHKVSEQTFYIWRKKFGVLDANDVKRLRELKS
jgi:putative transposase